MATIGQLAVSLGLDSKKFEDGINRAKGGLKTTAKIATVAGAAIATALVGIGVASTKMAVNFEKEMSSVGTLLGTEGSERVKELGEDVKNLSKITGKPLNDLAGGMYQVVSAFGDSEDSAKQLEISAKASAAGLATTTDAVNLLSAVTKGYGDTSEEAMQQASDLAFQTVKLGQTSFPELAASMGKVVPLAGSLKLSQEELFGAMATLTGVTGNTAEVSTQLRATLQSLMKPSTDMQVAIENMGYANGGAALEALGLQGVLSGLKDQVKGDEIAFSNMFGSIEAGTASLALTGSAADDFTVKTKAMGESAGATEEAFKIQQATVSATYERMRRSIDVVMVSLGEQFLPLLEEMFKWIEQYMPQIQATMDKVFTFIGEVVNEAVNIFNQYLLPAITAIYDWIKQYLPEIKDQWSNTFNSIGEIIKSFVELATAFWDKYGTYIMKQTRVIFDTIKGIISGILNTIKGLLDFWVGLFTGDWERMGEGLEKIWNGLWEAIEAVVRGAWGLLSNAFSALWDNVSDWFEGLKDDAKEWGKNMIGGFVDGIKSMGREVAKAAEEIVEKAGDFIKFWSPAKKGEGRFIVDWGENMIDGFLSGVKNAMPDVASTFNKVIPDMNPTLTPQMAGMGSTNTFNGGDIIIQNMTVRNNEDINLISRELHNLQKGRGRGQGIG